MLLNYPELYKVYLQKVEELLEDYTRPKSPFALYEPYKYIISGGGKRIRPILTMICCGIADEDPMEALKPAVAIEILHNFTLVHDDIMDKSPLRRGRETVHTKWNDATAILTGDVMVGSAYNLLPNSRESGRSDEIISAFTRGLIEVCEGQAFDMQFDERESITLDEYLMMIEKKTSALLETCAIIGGYCGFADEKMIDSLFHFAKALGIGFQIQDDLLDITAEQAKFGKKVGQDIIEGKKTYLIIKAIEKIKTGKDKELLDNFIKNKGMGEEYVDTFKVIFSKNGILKMAQDEVDNYFKKALNSIESIKESEYKNMLIWLVGTLNKRIY